MNYLFWNAGEYKEAKPNINLILKDLIIENQCDIVILAEYKSNVNQLLKSLEGDGVNLYKVPQIACKKIQIITKYYPEEIEHLPDDDKFTIKKIPHESLGSITVACVHFPSKLNSDNHTHMAIINKLKSYIREYEYNTNDTKTIIVGDFNLNPFEDDMVSAFGLHALNSRVEAKKEYRVVQKERYFMFYNPMWNLLGDEKSPPGTYYYNSGSHIKHFWFILDQVIVRPSLIDNFNHEALKIITKTSRFDLTAKNYIPNKKDISDHFPIYFIIN